MESRRPAHEVRIGRVRATVWPTESRHGTLYSVVVTRRYQSEGEWQTSSYLDQEDLLLAAKALDEAESWIRLQRSKRNEAAGPAEEVE